MKVVKIYKNYRNNTKEHFLVLLNEPYTNDDIDCLVEDWCESDPNGIICGYRFNWEFVEDEKIIKTVVEEEIRNIDNTIASLENRKIEIFIQLNYERI